MTAATVRVAAITLRDFRVYERANAVVGEGLTVVLGPNGAGKTNFLDAIYLGCTGRSFKTTNERELVRFSTPAARVELELFDGLARHEIAVTIAPPEERRLTVDRNPVGRLLDNPHRPLVSVFAPDRLELVKGPPALRRAHLDQLVAALWPARLETRRFYNQALAQRNACLGRIRGGQASPTLLDSWDLQLATHGAQLMADRLRAVNQISGPFVSCCSRLGLSGEAACDYQPRSHATTVAELVAEFEQNRAVDIDRGFTGHGPHRDEMRITRDGRDLRRYGSQGEQRIALLGLLFAEREALMAAREAIPLLLLDDVMSELDSDRRAALIELVADGGQTVITTTDHEHIPDTNFDPTLVLVEPGGRLSQIGEGQAG